MRTKPNLPDVNVLLALVDAGHIFRAAASRWLEQCAVDDIEIRIPYEVASSCVRLATNPKAMRDIVPPERTYDAITRLTGTPLTSLFGPTAESWIVFGTLIQGLRGHRSIPDLHLASLAIANDYRFVTFDRDFLRLEGFDVELLRA